MAKKKMSQQKALQLAQDNVLQIEAAYKFELESNPEYSLAVDPINKYNLPTITKEFVRHYIEYRNISTAAVICHIENDEALEIFSSFPVQQEIRRISKALYHRQFSKKMLTMDEICGYLSSLIDDSELPQADRLSTKNKLKVIELLIDLNKFKIGAMTDPSILMMKDITELVKNLSVGAIKSLINQCETSTNANEINKEIVKYTNAERIKNNEPTLSPEEAAYIESLSADEALMLLNEYHTNKGDNENE